MSLKRILLVCMCMSLYLSVALRVSRFIFMPPRVYILPCWYPMVCMTLPCVCSLHVYILSVRIPCMSPPCVCPICAHSVRMSSHIYVPADLRADVLSVYISSPCLRPLRVHSVHTSPHMYIVSYICRFVSRSLHKWSHLVKVVFMTLPIVWSPPCVSCMSLWYS